jgi:hypothetical protein
MKRFKITARAFLITMILGSLVLLGLPWGAQADQIAFGVSSQNIQFTGNGANSVTVDIGAAGLSGSAFDSDSFGSYAFGGPLTFTAGPQSSNLYPAGANSESFTYIDPEGDRLQGTVQWSFIQDNTTNPKFFGLLTITVLAGDAAFIANWGSIGSTANIDFTTNALSSGGTLDQLAATTNSATASISSGEVVPSVPEPGSLVLLGSGLTALGLRNRRRLSAR